MEDDSTMDNESPATPTQDEARQMMRDNTGIDSVVTVDGKLFRDGRLEALPEA